MQLGKHISIMNDVKIETTHKKSNRWEERKIHKWNKNNKWFDLICWNINRLSGFWVFKAVKEMKVVRSMFTWAHLEVYTRCVQINTQHGLWFTCNTINWTNAINYSFRLETATGETRCVRVLWGWKIVCLNCAVARIPYHQEWKPFVWQCHSLNILLFQSFPSDVCRWISSSGNDWLQFDCQFTMAHWIRREITKTNKFPNHFKVWMGFENSESYKITKNVWMTLRER